MVIRINVNGLVPALSRPGKKKTAGKQKSEENAVCLAGFDAARRPCG